MTINNPNVSLSQLGVELVWAKLERIDGKGSYAFLVNPEEVSWTHQADFSSLPVLYTAQPLAKYKSSTSEFSLPGVKFWSVNNSGDLTTLLATLRAMTKPVQAGQDLPLLKLSWGHWEESRLYLKTFSYRIRQWRSGKPTQADGSMSFVIAPEPAKAQYGTTPGAENKTKPGTNASSGTTETKTKLTDREREEYKTKIVAKLKSDKKLADRYNITATDYNTIKVDAEGKVKAGYLAGGDRELGKVSDFVTLKTGHKGI